jgi:pSer/pThr/pTyr-binding forkhead associated (FHA) protein
LESLNGTFATKQLDLSQVVKVGRIVSAKLPPTPQNGVFDSKVLSRNHAEIYWKDNKVRFRSLIHKVFIKDLKSSNGTFVNGIKVPEDSDGVVLRSGDTIDFGIDIAAEDGVSGMLQRH